MIEVEFVTLGDASETLKVPPPTLRNWTDQLEEFDVHYVKRNNRNERIYYNSDLEIFKFLRDLKAEHGRKTTTRDLANMIAEMGDRFELRSKEDAPVPKPSNRTSELMNHEDIKRLMESERVRQFVSIIRDELIEEVRETVRKEMQESADKIEDSLKRRDQEMIGWIEEQREKMKQLEEAKKLEDAKKSEEKKGFFARLFGG